MTNEAPSREAVARIVREQMREWWDEICGDTGCHPLDIKRERGSVLHYAPNHWTDAVAEYSADQIIALFQPPEPSRGDALREALTACVARLRQLEEFRDGRISRPPTSPATIELALAALATQLPDNTVGVEALRAALEKLQPFVRHNGMCGIVGGYGYCTCGLDEAQEIAALRIPGAPVVSALEELAGRCEQAAGPDRGLDAAIALALEPKRPGWFRLRDGWCRTGNGGGIERDPNFTGSVDAAKSLLLEGWHGSLSFGDQLTGVRIFAPGDWHSSACDGEARSIPTALCAAALRALSHMQEGSKP